VLRYRALVDSPAETLDSICAFLGVPQGVKFVVDLRAELLALGIADEVLPNVGPDIVDLVRGHILAAFDAAPTGDRTHRADRATRAWLQAAPERIDLAC